MQKQMAEGTDFYKGSVFTTEVRLRLKSALWIKSVSDG